MMGEIIAHIVLATWWSFAAIVFVGLRATGDEPAGHCLAVAVFWPVFTVLAVPVVLWRVPFKTAKTIRAGLMNRRLLRDFNRWVEERGKDDDAA